MRIHSPLKNHSWVLLIVLIIGSCSSTTSENRDVAIGVSEQSETIKIIDFYRQRLGQFEDKNTTQLNTGKNNLGSYLIQEFTSKKVISNVDLNFYFDSDSINRIAFEEVKSYLNHQWGSTTGDNHFCSWDTHSQRGNLATILLIDRSKLYGHPAMEVKIIENDDRAYHKK